MVSLKFTNQNWVKMGTILVVDDDEPIRKLIRQTLELDGHEVFEAADGDEAIEMQKLHAAQIIFMDIIMPEKEGIETIMEIRRSLPGTKIVAMSGAGFDSPYLVIARQLGADITLQKPFSPDKISEIVTDLLEQQKS